MSARKVIAASAAALALVVMSVPVVNAQGDAQGDAQDDASESGSLPFGGLFGGSLEEGSLSDASAGNSGGGDADGSADGDSGPAGSPGSAGSAGNSLSELVPGSGEVCELPGLGGSVAKFYPLFGITGIPTGVIDLVTTALDSFPNLLELVAGEAAGATLLGQTGSLNEGLCTSIFGGEMVMPPETVYVDEGGQPVTTVTATVSPGAGSSGSGGSTASRSADTTADSSPEQDPEIPDSDASAAGDVRPTTVPVPGL